MSQAQLAERAEVTDETVSRMERGTYEPALSTVAAISGALGLSIDYLCGRTRSVERPRVTKMSEELVTLARHLDQSSAKALLPVVRLLHARRIAALEPRKHRS